MRKNNKYYIRKAHRFLGVLIGIQFLFWTISGLYFTWTDLDEIHGDHFLKEASEQNSVNSQNLNLLSDTMEIHSMELKFLNQEAYYWVNDSILIHVASGDPKTEISAEEAKSIARDKIKPEYKIQDVNLLTETDAHHEYRGRDLPVWQIEFEGGESLKAYIDAQNGDFQTVRHRDWRWFDFLWMTHTMDYETRDDFNNTLIRAFSVFGLLTVSSGFLLFFVTTKRKRKKKSKKSQKKN
ncbi:hypothetical protein MATR_08430 [Marivirga tractuosa]|uniref:PepSY domain-containing protein n=1 Tax=Marivirga tractuosa (strain ATCC 23168 / DSM 4126 / NBRC 15989 / NCIMB 1408 / VKM B-1430 / H-43) TaxID=643867 RepID=E4TPE0_MARTH|nr:PepSY domain-containing protein [Marivirga tractuosa]ADR21528.1 hypothetical protein Ftrac_1538 [Marivirga tractuosa DSM 4126]BDD14018.1 hypothetical protein MATR_08430 [Marivirga tractuosa]